MLNNPTIAERKNNVNKECVPPLCFTPGITHNGITFPAGLCRISISGNMLPMRAIATSNPSSLVYNLIPHKAISVKEK